MTLTALDLHDPLDLHDDQGGPDNGPSLDADPWTDNWTLPTAEELKAIGWPGARPSQPDGSRILSAVPDLDPDPDSMAVERIVEPILETPAVGQFEPPSPPVPGTPDMTFNTAVNRS